MRPSRGSLVWILLTLIAAVISSLGSLQARDFYTHLNRPSWSPPGWIFGPVWTILYAGMALAATWAWRLRGTQNVKTAFTFYALQLGLNALWSWLFFAWRFGAAAFAEIVVLWLAIAVTLVLFSKLRPASGWLLLPYLAWVTFAGFLCFTVWRLNPTAL